MPLVKTESCVWFLTGLCDSKKLSSSRWRAFSFTEKVALLLSATPNWHIMLNKRGTERERYKNFFLKTDDITFWQKLNQKRTPADYTASKSLCPFFGQLTQFKDHKNPIMIKEFTELKKFYQKMWGNINTLGK